MDLLTRILTGEAGAIDALASGDSASWTTLTEHLFQEAPPAAPAALVEAMLAKDPDARAWIERAKDGVAQARSPWFTTVTSAMQRVRPWLSAGVLAVRPPGDPAVLWLRFEALRSTVDEDALPRARALAEDAERAGAPASLRAHTLLLLARLADEEGQREEGLAAARRAAELDPELAPIAARRVGALLFRARRVEEALAVLEPVMEQRGPLFGGVGAFLLRGDDDEDPLDAALDEAATIASWASRTTPEWVRALGGIAERSGLTWTRFEQALEAMLAASTNPLSDLEVVARQAGQRGMVRTALAAAEALAARFPEDLEAAAIAAPHLAAAGQVDRALALFSAVARDPRTIAETSSGHALVEALVRELVARGDRRALEVQQRLVDAKHELWGECPALALERHNLATIHAELGDHAEARRKLEAALADLRRELGDGHPDVELAKRSLARLDASSRSRGSS